MELSERLSLLSKFLPEDAQFADIGSDHAYLPVSFCQKHPEARAIAGEVNEGPLRSAQSEITRQELEDRVEARLGDGLEVLENGEVNAVVIAGMGGPLIASILDKGKDKLEGVQRLLLQPNIHAVAVRRWLEEHGFCLVHEEILEENGHVYEILIADRHADESLYSEENKEVEMWLGPLLMKQKAAPFMKKWESHLNNRERILKQLELSSQNQEEKKRELTREIGQLKEVLYNEYRKGE
ncbi:tRNA (adenine(22)-N(1))-methyltransferase [Salimicrobium halophilum]|uniref:tRNA (Adenine22-N1)-methyltransferase n=1 Tax=Salimicrobium halophilum TaxID=86666 RepID=A0A1G8PQY4_9BACI|nr:tRNA (adenine(22)-N(1))-methyltransferase TrmK [Salimicrobium halophilum]SDI94924.1 tRNA (adenine22-N1)-methyltransferase [Salimicrobium halophilum]